MKEKLTYENAYKELNNIVHEIEDSIIKLDSMKEKIDRATELITFCRGRLRETEEEFNKAMEKLETNK